MAPRRSQQGEVQTWVNSRWKNPTWTGQISVEINSPSDVVGIFPNEAAVTRLIGALLLEQNDEWAVQRARYMTLETIATLDDDRHVSLPPLAA